MSTCQRCAGSGLIGVGWVLIPCPTCNGTGTVSEGAEDDRGFLSHLLWLLRYATRRKGWHEAR